MARVPIDARFPDTYWDSADDTFHFPGSGGAGTPTTYDVFTAAGQTKGSPAAPAVGDLWWTINPSAAYTATTLDGTAAATLDGSAALTFDGPFALLWRYMAADVWFCISVKTGTIQ